MLVVSHFCSVFSEDAGSEFPESSGRSQYAVNKTEVYIFWFIIDVFKTPIIGMAWRTETMHHENTH